MIGVYYLWLNFVFCMKYSQPLIFGPQLTSNTMDYSQLRLIDFANDLLFLVNSTKLFVVDTRDQHSLFVGTEILSRNWILFTATRIHFSDAIKIHQQHWIMVTATKIHTWMATFGEWSQPYPTKISNPLPRTAKTSNQTSRKSDSGQAVQWTQQAKRVNIFRSI